MEITKEQIILTKKNDIINNVSKQLNATHNQITQSLSELYKCKTLDEAKSFDSAKSLIDAIGGIGLPLETKKRIDVETKYLIDCLILTDYKEFKNFRGEYTIEEWNLVNSEREVYRQEIRNIENKINACTTIEELQAMEV